uniref:Zinc ABC transporter substrate-binding protein n=1 Tax=Geoglobus ahangari TaxID=113653 RepID=A0A7C3YG62_9EURY
MWKVNTLILLILIIFPAKALIVVTIPDFKPIVQDIVGDKDEVISLMTSGDPHSFSLSGKDIETLRNAKLIVLANSDLIEFERKIAENFDNTLDFKDYGVELRDFPGYPQNPHGYWMDPKNAISIAKAVKEKLSEIYPQHSDYFDKNYANFVERVMNAEKEAKKLVKGGKFVAMVPEVCYIASSLNIEITHILLSEGAGFLSGKELEEVKEKLKKGEIEGILAPEFMKGTKGEETAEMLAKETGCKIAWVKFASGDIAYDTQLLSNAARIAYATRPCNCSDFAVYILGTLCVLEAALIFIIKVR